MKNLISNKLLSEVLGEEVTEIKGMCEFKKDELEYYVKDTEFSRFYSRINIYKLAHKCKIKAYKLGYTIDSNPTNSKIYDKEGQLKDTCYNTNFDNPTIFDPMLDILVFEWIIENKDNK